MTIPFHDFTAVPQRLHFPSVKMSDGQRLIARAARKFTGASVFLAAIFLGLLPPDGVDIVDDLLKLTLAFALAVLGAAMWKTGRPIKSPHLELDLERNEARLIRVHGHARSVIERCSFAKLTAAEIDRHMMRLWNRNRLMAEVAVPSNTTLNLIRAHLRSAGHDV